MTFANGQFHSFSGILFHFAVFLFELIKISTHANVSNVCSLHSDLPIRLTDLRATFKHVLRLTPSSIWGIFGVKLWGGYLTFPLVEKNHIRYLHAKTKHTITYHFISQRVSHIVLSTVLPLLLQVCRRQTWKFQAKRLSVILSCTVHIAERFVHLVGWSRICLRVKSMYTR